MCRRALNIFILMRFRKNLLCFARTPEKIKHIDRYNTVGPGKFTVVSDIYAKKGNGTTYQSTSANFMTSF